MTQHPPNAVVARQRRATLRGRQRLGYTLNGLVVQGDILLKNLTLSLVHRRLGPTLAICFEVQ